MSEKINLEQVRGAALDRIERGERNFKLALYAAAVCEALFLAAFILAADFSNRLHVLLLISFVGSYSVVLLGLFALGAHVNRSTLRVLRAVELTKERAHA